MADARGADMYVAYICPPGTSLHRHIIHKNDPHAKPDFMVKVPDPNTDMSIASIMYPRSLPM